MGSIFAFSNTAKYAIIVLAAYASDLHCALQKLSASKLRDYINCQAAHQAYCERSICAEPVSSLEMRGVCARDTVINSHIPAKPAGAERTRAHPGRG